MDWFGYALAASVGAVVVWAFRFCENGATEDSLYAALDYERRKRSEAEADAQMARTHAVVLGAQEYQRGQFEQKQADTVWALARALRRRGIPTEIQEGDGRDTSGAIQDHLRMLRGGA